MVDVASDNYRIRFYDSIQQINAAEWDAVAAMAGPFLSHAFLALLEDSKSVTAQTGWQPHHLTVTRKDAVVAVMPCYIKTHSYGEYVFDFAWADAYHRYGLAYYPKLLTAIPFTPCTGTRICIAESERGNQKTIQQLILDALKSEADRLGCSSWHCLFSHQEASDQLGELGALQRIGTQFQWQNDGFDSFDDFLGTFNSRKRKSTKRERAVLAESGLRITCQHGHETTEQDWDDFYQFYQLTYAKKSGHSGYLTHRFFRLLPQRMPDNVLLVRAHDDTACVAASLFFVGDDTLYGRYWGCRQSISGLHFELCYYRGIEYCINNQLKLFESGAQGEHKIQRGFKPIITYSNHWIREPEFHHGIKQFIHEESRQVDAYRNAAADLLPYKCQHNSG